MTRFTPGICSFLLIVCPAVVAPVLGGENWTSYRGPTDQGHVLGGNLPIQWSETENVVWKTEIPGKAWSSPVIEGNRIWLTNTPEDGSWLAVICVDKRTGKIVLNQRLLQIALPAYCHPFNSYGSPSPVIENGRVYISFGAPYNACLNAHTGEIIWQRTDFTCNHFRGPGSSPFLFHDLLILHFDGSDQQYLVAMDKHTGKTVWRTDRTMDFRDIDNLGNPKHEGDYRKAFSTPVIANVAGQPVLISLGSMALYGYVPQTGKELWRVEATGSHSGACRPVTGHGLVFSPMGSGKELRAVRPNGSGLVNDTHIVWTYNRAVPQRPSLLLVDELLFMIDNAGVTSCLEAVTGQEIWRSRVGGDFSASPIYSDGKIWLFDQKGKSTVITAGRTFQVLAENQLDDGFWASPAASGNALYLRTRTHLYRIEDQSQT